MAYVAAPHSVAAPLANPVKLLIQRLSGALQRSRAQARVHAELSALTDRELADIGLNRAMIGDVARSAGDLVA